LTTVSYFVFHKTEFVTSGIQSVNMFKVGSVYSCRCERLSVRLSSWLLWLKCYFWCYK